MQQPLAACTKAQILTRPCPCARCNWLLHPDPTSAQDGLDPSSATCAGGCAINQHKDLTYTCSGHQLQLALVDFSFTNKAFTNVHICT